jgi:hypothetical protein
MPWLPVTEALKVCCLASVLGVYVLETFRQSFFHVDKRWRSD